MPGFYERKKIRIVRNLPKKRKKQQEYIQKPTFVKF